MNPYIASLQHTTRRHFLKDSAAGLGAIALSALLGRNAMAVPTGQAAVNPLAARLPHFAPKAKRVIYLHLTGSPPNLDLFDYKPELVKRTGEDLPASVRMGQRLTGMSAQQATLPMAGSVFKFARHGQAGTWISELLPWTAKVADDFLVAEARPRTPEWQRSEPGRALEQRILTHLVQSGTRGQVRVSI